MRALYFQNDSIKYLFALCEIMQCTHMVKMSILSAV